MCVQNDELSVLGMAPGGSGDETSSQTADGRPERVQFVRAHPTDVDLSDIDLSDIDLSHIDLSIDGMYIHWMASRI